MLHWLDWLDRFAATSLTPQVTFRVLDPGGRRKCDCTIITHLWTNLFFYHALPTSFSSAPLTSDDVFLRQTTEAPPTKSYHLFLTCLIQARRHAQPYNWPTPLRIYLVSRAISSNESGFPLATYPRASITLSSVLLPPFITSSFLSGILERPSSPRILLLAYIFPSQ